MKISPVATVQNTVQGDPQVARAAMAVRSLKMNTNSTPGVVPPAPAEDPLTKTATTEGAVEATQPLSPQMAAIRREKRALQLERQAFEQEKAESQAKATQASGIDRARLKSEPLRVLLEEGVTYEQLTEAILADPNNTQPEIQALKAEIAALKGDVTKQLTDRDAQAEQAVLAEMRREADRLAADGEDFELIRTTGSIDQVMELIEKTYRTSGEVLETREAMQLIEDELITESLKLAAAKKVQGKLAPQLPQPTSPQQRPMTLTNRDTATPPMSRKERALLAFAGQLPKR
jgi:hypothetical protein